MKIYYIANARMPNERAHGIQIAKMCEALIEEGADLELVVPNRKTVPQNMKEFYDLRVSVPQKKLPVVDFYIKGKKWFVLSSLSFMISYFFFLAFKKIKGEEAFVYTIDMDNFSSCLVPLAGFPFFIEMHSAKKKNFLSSFWIKKARGLAVINQIIKDLTVRDFGINPDRIIVEPNGIDLGVFSADLKKEKARADLELPQDKKIIVYLGKFYSWKGLEIINSAFENLGSDSCLYLIGGTKEEFENVSGISPDNPNFYFLGHVDYRRIPLWLSSADILLVLGTKNNEYSYSQTSPMKIFEYMAVKRPVVASRTPAIRQIVSDDEVFFYEPDDPRSLWDVCQSVFLEGGRSLKIKNAYEKIKSLSWNKRAGEILKFIK